MKRLLLLVAPLALFVLLFSDALAAFCGFYVARADAKLFNRASQVVLVRDGDRTVLDDGERLPGRPEGVCGRHSGAVGAASASRFTSATRRSSTISTPTPRRGWWSTSMRIRANAVNSTGCRP